MKNPTIIFLICAVLTSRLFAAEVEGIVSSSGEAPPEKTRFTIISPGISPVLEEKTYENRIVHYLTDKGLVYAPDDPRAMRISYTYSSDKGHTEMVGAPVYGPTGAIAVYGGGWRHRGYWGGGIAVPTYGPVGVAPQPVTVFTRELILSFATSKGTLVHQIKLVSTGPGNDLQYVMPALIHAALKKYPMEPGRRKEVSADIE